MFFHFMEELCLRKKGSYREKEKHLHMINEQEHFQCYNDCIPIGTLKLGIKTHDRRSWWVDDCNWNATSTQICNKCCRLKSLYLLKFDKDKHEQWRLSNIALDDLMKKIAKSQYIQQL